MLVNRFAPALPVIALSLLAACADDPLTAPSPRLDVSPAVASAAALVRDRYIVVFRRGVTDAPGLTRALLRVHRGALLHSYGAALTGFAARLPAGVAEALRRHPAVESVEPDRVVPAAAAPAASFSALMHAGTAQASATQASATQTGATWGLDRLDQRNLPLSTTYTTSATGAGVTAYIIDSGIRLDHAEFGKRAASGYDFYDDDPDASTSCDGHGTHVAGTVGGASYGVAKGVRLVSVRVFPCDGGSGTMSGLIAAVDWVTANHRKPAVANMSLSSTAYHWLNVAVANSIAAGVVYAVAAGNESADACGYSPASTPEALTVAASSLAPSADGGTLADERAWFSNYGRCVDLFAPGDQITSAWHTSATATHTIGGTSMATPHVTGVVALYLEQNPGATPVQVASALIGSATPGMVGRDGGSPNLLVYHADAPAASQTVALVGGQSGRCLDVLGASREPGAELVLYSCHGGENQQFALPAVGATGEVRVYGTLCLDAAGGDGQNGDRLILWSCHGGANQRWTRTPAGELRGLNDRCADVYGARTEDLSGVVLWDCHGGSNQRWEPARSTVAAR